MVAGMEKLNNYEDSENNGEVRWLNRVTKEYSCLFFSEVNSTLEIVESYPPTCVNSCIAERLLIDLVVVKLH